MNCLIFTLCGKKKGQSRSVGVNSGTVLVPFMGAVCVFQALPKVEGNQVKNAELVTQWGEKNKQSPQVTRVIGRIVHRNQSSGRDICPVFAVYFHCFLKSDTYLAYKPPSL